MKALLKVVALLVFVVAFFLLLFVKEWGAEEGVMALLAGLAFYVGSDVVPPAT